MVWHGADEPDQALLWIVSYIHFGQAGHIYQGIGPRSLYQQLHKADHVSRHWHDWGHSVDNYYHNLIEWRQFAFFDWQ